MLTYDDPFVDPQVPDFSFCLGAQTLNHDVGMSNYCRYIWDSKMLLKCNNAFKTWGEWEMKTIECDNEHDLGLLHPNIETVSATAKIKYKASFHDGRPANQKHIDEFMLPCPTALPLRKKHVVVQQQSERQNYSS